MDEEILKSKLALILGKNVSQVEQMEFVYLLEKLVGIIEEYEKTFQESIIIN